ncbi:hypothetical protein CBS9595_001968 [Malassezia furfur]|nr:hypothetical protein CBS9595_001968 [Malassezia furfur]
MDRDATADALQRLTVQDLPKIAEDDRGAGDKEMPPPRVDPPDDTPPVFPSFHSAQRQAGPPASLKPLRTAPSLDQKLAAPKLVPPANPLRAPAGGLQPPIATSTARLNNSGRKKVALEPGCSPLDWARIKNSTDLRGGVTSFLRVTPSELKRHSSRSDAWTALEGKVYNMTPYLRFHPGGQETLMRIAGRDGTRLFFLTHSWVNIEAVIGPAMVGMLVPEPE